MSDNPSSEVQINGEADSLPGVCVANAGLMPEPVVHPVAKFLLALKEVNIYIAIQSVLDAMDLWLGALKYYYDILNPIGNKASTAMMYSELRTPIGLLVFMLGGLFFATFAFLGNYYDPKRKDSKLPEFSKYADASWPFVRDCLKGLKWTFKGTKSILIVMNLLLQLNCTSLIAPLGVIFGIVAASNRFWNRDMVEKRKDLQSTNNAFRENIKYINTCFMEINDSAWVNNFENLSEENKSCYRGCVIKISQHLSKSSDATQLKENGWYDKYYYVNYDKDTNTYQLKLFYCNSHPLYVSDEKDLKGRSIQITHESLTKLIQQTPENRLKYAGQTIISGPEVYYCDLSGELFFVNEKLPSFHLRLTPADLAAPQVPDLIENVVRQTKNILPEHLNELLQQGYSQELGAKYNIGVDEYISCDDNCYFYINLRAEIECFKKVAHSLVRLERSNFVSDAKKLSQHEILFFNQRKIDKEKKLDYFHYKTLLKNEVHHPGLLQNILQDKTFFIDEKIKNVIELKKLYEIPKFQPNSSGSYFSAFTSGLLNAPYYFLGILTMASIPDNLLIFAVGICSFFMLLNVVAELYQEFDFQRRLDITAVKAKLSMIKRCISLEWDAINEYLSDSVPTPNELEYSFFDILPAKKNYLGSHGELELKYELSLINLFLTDDEKIHYQQLCSPHRFEDGLDDESQAELTKLIQSSSLRRNQFKSHFEQKKDMFIDDEQIQNHYRKVFGGENREIRACEFNFLTSLVRLEQYSEEYKVLNKRLKTNLVIQPLATIMQGIKNGLHIYGMFNGLLITIYSMGAWSFNLSFFIFSITVGISLVLFSTIYTALFARPEEKDTPNIENTPESSSDTPHFDKIIAFQEKNNPEDLKVPYWYDKAKYDEIITNDNAIVPSKNLLISEQCEVFRQFISGFKKGIKFLESIFLLLPSVNSEPSVFTAIFYPIVALVYGVIFALKGLRGLMRVDKDDYENSPLVGRFFSKPDVSTTLKPESQQKTEINLNDNQAVHSQAINSATKALAGRFTPISFVVCASESSNNLASMNVR